MSYKIRLALSMNVNTLARISKYLPTLDTFMAESVWFRAEYILVYLFIFMVSFTSTEITLF